MADPKYFRPGFDFALSHAIEEAGEFLAAAGKTQRFGAQSVNPELPVDRQETNITWLKREMADLRAALDRIDAELAEKLRDELSEVGGVARLAEAHLPTIAHGLASRGMHAAAANVRLAAAALSNGAA